MKKCAERQKRITLKQVQKHLTPEQIAEGQRLTRQCIKATLKNDAVHEKFLARPIIADRYTDQKMSSQAALFLSSNFSLN